MYGTQTKCLTFFKLCKFENDVKMYGTQTSMAKAAAVNKFENDVKMYGTQTADIFVRGFRRLRMM